MVDGRPQPHVQLDCRGTLCPVPVTRTAARVSRMRPGELLEVLGDDPGMQIDIPAWCLSNRHELLSVQRAGSEFRCLLRVGGDPQQVRVAELPADRGGSL